MASAENVLWPRPPGGLCQVRSKSHTMQRVTFLYRRSRLRWGSTTMRAHQLSQIIAPELPDFHFDVTPFSRHRFVQILWAQLAKPGTVFIATKGVVRNILPETLDILHRRSCRVCLDIVDMRRDQWPGPELAADCFISSSLTGVGKLNAHIQQKFSKNNNRPLVAPLLHNADIRLYDNGIIEQDSARVVYWGDYRNAVLSERIRSEVSVHQANDEESFSATIQAVRNFNVHYAIRPTDPEEWRIKPFTKGANAAVMGAVVLVNKGVPDAVELLGEDYPFLVNGNDEEHAIAGISHVKEEFGGKEWSLAKERCKDLAHRVSPKSLARQLVHIVTELGA